MSPEDQEKNTSFHSSYLPVATDEDKKSAEEKVATKLLAFFQPAYSESNKHLLDSNIRRVIEYIWPKMNSIARISIPIENIEAQVRENIKNNLGQQCECLLERDEKGFFHTGTGFLLNSGIMVTNNHVLVNEMEALGTELTKPACATFNVSYTLL